MATQKACTEHLKKWQEAASMKDAVEAATKAVQEFNGLYEESAKNLLGRTPDLLLLLSAYQAGRLQGEKEESARWEPVQESF